MSFVAGLGAAGFAGTQRLIPFGPSPRTNQALRRKDPYEEYLAR
jgi:hypothetical protein